MNKALLVGLGLLVLVGVGGYLILSQRSTSSLPQETTSSQSTPLAMEKKSLRDLMSIGQSQQCTFTDPESGSLGTMYIGTGDTRGDFVSEANGQTVNSHIISDDTSVYFWTDGQTQGYRASFDAMESVAGGTGVQKTVDVNKQVDYSCAPWVIDSAMFEMPAAVTFSDFSAMMEDVENLIPSEVAN